MNKISQQTWNSCLAFPSPGISWIASGLLVLALQCLPAFGQEKPPPPTAPFFNKPTPGTMWVVEIKENGVPADSAESLENGGEQRPVLPVRLEVKFGHNRILQGILTFSDKSRVEYYVADGSIMQVYSNSPSIAASPMAREQANIFSLRVPAFPGLAWLAVENFVGIESVKDVDYYRFYTTKRPNDPTWDVELTALIRVADRHPARVVIGTTEYRISEIAPFAGEIELPREFHAKLADVRKRKDSREALRRINERTSTR